MTNHRIAGPWSEPRVAEARSFALIPGKTGSSFAGGRSPSQIRRMYDRLSQDAILSSAGVHAALHQGTSLPPAAPTAQHLLASRAVAAGQVDVLLERGVID